MKPIRFPMYLKTSIESLKKLIADCFPMKKSSQIF